MIALPTSMTRFGWLNSQGQNLLGAARSYWAPALGARGIGEIGITGVGAAIANAVYHATGIRIRELPITLDKLLGKETVADSPV